MSDLQVRYVGSKAAGVTLNLGGVQYHWPSIGAIRTVPERFLPELNRYDHTFATVTPEHVYLDSATLSLTPVTEAVDQIMEIPAYTEITEVSLVHESLGTSVPLSLGYLPVDLSEGDDEAFIAGAGYAGAVATTAGAPYRIVLEHPVVITKASYLIVTYGTVVDGAEAASFTATLAGFSTGVL